MTKTTTITINGRLYDAITGMPIVATSKVKAMRAQAASKAAAQPHPAQPAIMADISPAPAQAVAPKKHAAQRSTHPGAQAVHAKPQKSQTLYRKALKKPAAPIEASMSTKDLPGRSPLISKFGNHTTIHPDLTKKGKALQKQDEAIAPAQLHPTVAKVLQQNMPVAQQEQVRGTELKEQLIKERLAEVSDAPQQRQKRRWFKSKPRLVSALTVSLAILVLGGYLTYMNLPVISMKVAASRAGVEATFPNYRPDGYGLNGPITYSPGEVNINYKSNTNDSNFKITQKSSNWDSQGLLDNYVSRQTENYLTFQERGVTVYTFGNKAAWVNGGLLYTIDGDASLSAEQVLRLATSM